MILIYYSLENFNIFIIEYFIVNFDFIPINNIDDHLSLNFKFLNQNRTFIF
jgi:hypothetical protein